MSTGWRAPTARLRHTPARGIGPVPAAPSANGYGYRHGQVPPDR
jgi:hypothetical protein